MRRLLIPLALVCASCQSDQTGPPASSPRHSFAVAESEGPPSPYPFGPDTYRLGLFTGAGRHKLDCSADLSGARTCDGFLRSTVDKTLLDARLQIPAGAGPHALVVLMHGYAGSKSSSGDIADQLLAEDYAVLRYSTRGFGDSWGQVNLADLNAEIGDLHSMIGDVVDEPDFDLDPNHVAVTGASYGGGHSWLALVNPTFVTEKRNTGHVVSFVPIAPCT